MPIVQLQPASFGRPLPTFGAPVCAAAAAAAAARGRVSPVRRRLLFDGDAAPDADEEARRRRLTHRRLQLELAHLADEQKRRWNFDFVEERPLAGNYVWQHLDANLHHLNLNNNNNSNNNNNNNNEDNDAQNNGNWNRNHLVQGVKRPNSVDEASDAAAPSKMARTDVHHLRHRPGHHLRLVQTKVTGKKKQNFGQAKKKNTQKTNRRRRRRRCRCRCRFFYDVAGCALLPRSLPAATRNGRRRVPHQRSLV